jgi:phosphopantetheine--protein transferase-like protein
MVGDKQMQKTVEFLSRLLGERVDPDWPVRMNSLQRAAFSSWIRKEGLPINASLIGKSEPSTLLDLFDNDDGAKLQVTTKFAQLTPPADFAPVAGIGIDIEDIANLPQADDYREHTFFKDNFTATELSYCLMRPDVRASLCGMWAAKEALIKAGLTLPQPHRLDAIEITHDEVGRPTYPGWQLSISHTATTAVALCVALPASREIKPTETPERAPGSEPPNLQPMFVPKSFRMASALWVVVAIVSGGILLALGASWVTSRI